MAVRALVGSPAAVGCTLLGSLAVGAVAVVGWRLAVAIRATGVTANPVFLGGLGDLLLLGLAGVVLALAALAWVPFAAGVAYAVGRESDTSVGLGETLRGVARRREPLYRWTRSRAVPAVLADRVLGEADVAPNEVAVGCEKFVLPALLTDAPELRTAVDRANRVTPPHGRERVVGAGLAVTTGLALAVVGAGAYVGQPLEAVSTTLGGVVGVFGVVATAALDVAWRTETYRREDLSAGFVGTPPSRLTGER